MTHRPSLRLPALTMAGALLGAVSLAADPVPSSPLASTEARVLIRYRNVPGPAHREHLTAQGASV
ncbi:MAG: hypothetical protein LW626_11790, partial [Verrucomicrobium sp.]|nr:hypothetical protein [Verrucomicrobium sp.]